MAALDDLISQIQDESLRERIRAEVKRANRQKKLGVKIEPCKWVWAKKNVGRIDVQPKRATLRSDPTQAARYTAENGGRNAAVFRVQPLPPSG